MLKRLFISYRREDSASTAAALYRDLVEQFGKDQVFLDHRGIAGGEKWEDRLRNELNRATVVFFLVGSGWLSARDPRSHKRRLDLEDDWVRLEIEHALAGQATVVPVLLNNQQPFAPDSLKSPLLEKLFLRQVMRLRDHDWKDDLRDLAALLEGKGFDRNAEVADGGASVPGNTPPSAEAPGVDRPEAEVARPPRDDTPPPAETPGVDRPETELPGPPRDETLPPGGQPKAAAASTDRVSRAIGIGLVVLLAVVLGWATFFEMPRLNRNEARADSVTRQFVDGVAGHDAEAVASLARLPFFLGEERLEEPVAVIDRFGRAFSYAREGTGQQSDSRSLRAVAQLAAWLAEQQAKPNTNVQGMLELDVMLDLGREDDEERGIIPPPTVPMEKDAVRVALRIPAFESGEFDVAYLYYSVAPQAVWLRGIILRRE